MIRENSGLTVLSRPVPLPRPGFSRSPLRIGAKCGPAIVILRLCLTWLLLATGSRACQAAEPVERPGRAEANMAGAGKSEGPLLGSAEANTPARLDAAATSASQPLSPRPLFCCRPEHSAQPDAGGGQVHPTLAALAEAIRPRRAPKPIARQPRAMPSQLPPSQAADTFDESQSSPVESYAEPEPLRHESPELHEEMPTPAAEAAPRVIANPWMTKTPAKASIAARALAAGPAAQTPRPAAEKKQSIERPAAPPAEQRGWRSSEPRSVSLTRYHPAEPPRAARGSLAPIAERPAASPVLAENSAAENPLRGSETVRVSRSGDWSSASANPLR